MTSSTGTRTIMISAVVVAVASVAAVAVMIVGVVRSSSSDMSGMHHGGDEMSMSAPATTSADPHGGMAGMDMSGTEQGSEATLSAPPTISEDPHGDMPGMDMGSGDVHPTSPPPTTSGEMPSDMPGMDMSGTDHGSGDAPTTSPPPSGSGEMPGMDMGSGDTHGNDPGHSSMVEEASPVRPLVPVLGTFGGGTSAVLLAAGFLRRKDRIRNQAKAAARAARRSAK